MKESIKRDIIENMGAFNTLEDEVFGGGNNEEGGEMVFDWELLQSFSTNIFILFDSNSVANAQNPKNSYLDLKALRNS